MIDFYLVDFLTWVSHTYYTVKQMSMIQMELNLDNKSDIELKVDELKVELANTKESLRKIQKKLFGEMSLLRKVCLTQQKEIQELRDERQDNKHQKPVTWIYEKGDCLFVEENHQQASCN